MKVPTFLFILGLCAGPGRAAPAPVDLSPTGDASQNAVQLRGFSCDRPQSSRVLSYRGACSATDAVLTEEAQLQVIQHVPRFEIPAYRCRLTRDLAISYCGFSSYTQHLPFGYYGQSYALTREECRMAVQEKRFKTVLGVYKELKVPGLTAFQEIIAGEERFEAGVVTCVGEHAHLQGRFLKGVVAE